MRNPTVNNRGWMSGDVFRLVLNLYQGAFGKMLNMQLPSNPTLTILADGKTEMNMDLRWGSQHDSIKLLGDLSVVAPNKLKASARAVNSAALKVTLPSLQRTRQMRMTYFDGELMVLRDDRDVVDVFWRRHAGRVPEVRSSEREDSQPTTSQAEPSPREMQLGEQVDNLLTKVEVLKGALETQREQSAEDRAQSEQLRAQIARLEKEAESAAVTAQAHVMKLDVMDSLTLKLSEETGSQQQKSSEKGQTQAKLQTEFANLQAQTADIEERLGKLATHEDSLRSQIPELEQQLWTGPRDSWSGFRAAIKQARSELAEVLKQSRLAKRTAATLKRQIARKQGELRKSTGETDAEAAARKRLEEQLEEREREITNEKARLAEAVGEREALSTELGEVRSKLAVLEASEAQGQERALAVEAELEEIINQAKEAQKLGKSLKDGKDKPKSRGWFR